jgi:hypothetical protein
MGTRWARFARGWLAAAFATFVAALFHVASGGETPGMVGLAIALAFSAMACILLAGKSLSLWRLTVSVALSQFLFHALFGLGGSGPVIIGTAAHAHHVTHIDISALTAGGTADAHQHSLFASDSTMWLGHATAALLTVLMLRYGERAFWGLRERARVQVTRFVASVAPVPLDVALGSPVVVRLIPLRDAAVLIGRMRHRGPPTRLAFA